MRTRMIFLALVSMFVLGLVACEDQGSAESVGEQIDDAISEAEDRLEDAEEEAEEAAEAIGDALQQN